jgi:hypothetical protein
MTCAAVILAATTPVQAGGKPEALDAAFLEYLASCEGKNDNWTVVADEKQRRRVESKKPAAQAPPPKEPAKQPEARP